MRVTIIRLELAVSTLLLGVAPLWSAFRGLDLATATRPSLAPLIVGTCAGLALAMHLAGIELYRH